MRKKVWSYFKIIVPASAVLAACIASLFLIPFRANADGETITDDYIVKRSLYQGLSSCYQNSLASSIAVDSSGYSTRVDAIFSKDAPHLYLPTGFGSKSEYACKRKDAGLVTSAVPSLMSSLASSVSLGTAEARDKYFEGMGFVGSNSNGDTASGERCFWYEFSYGSISNAKSNTVCLTAGENGEVLSVSDEGGADNKGGDFSILISVSFEGRNYAGRLANCGSDAICLDAIFTYPDGMGYSFEQTISLYDQYLDAAKVDDIAQFIPAQAEAIASTAQFYAGSSTFTVTGESETKSGPGATTVDNNTYTSTGNTTDMLNKAITYLNGSNDSSLTEPFDDTELYYIYMDYLKDIYGAQIAYNFCADNSQGEAYIPVIRATENGEKYWQYCAIDNLSAVESSSQKVRTGSTMGSEEKASQVIDYLQAMNTANLDINRLTESELEESTVGVTDPDGEGEGDTDDAEGTTTAPCYESAGALGWIICPVIKGVGGAVSGLYSYISDSFLEVDAELFASGESVYQGWQYFQGLANVIFAIFFIIVILSQVTGIGLSNYGIKKILPRLIAVAILVNLSFIVCQLAVDVSNILGYSLENLLSNIPIAGSSPFSFGDAIGSIVSTLLTGAGLVIGGATLVVTWELWLLPFLLTLLVAIISVIFFFIILGVRKAGVILLVVLAPVAIICYALPNTKKLFDRWLKMFSSLLLVFPICGLLMGGGQFASNLLIKAGGSSEGFFYYLVAMLLTVVPFFFIPALLKGSMAAMGALGAKISGFGSRLGHGASGALKRSERVQDWNKRLRVNTQYRRAQRTMARAEKKGHTLSASQTRRISRAKAAFEKQSLEDAANRHYAGRSADQIDAAIAAQDIKFQQQQVEEEASRIMTGGVDFTDASSHTRAINANDVGDLTMAYDQAIGRSLNMANSAEVRAAATLQAKALQQLLMGKGDTGRSQMLKTLRTHTYSAQGNRAQEDAVKQLYSHLNDNDKWMASIKAADIGSYSLINDAASANPGLSKIKTAAEYNVMGSNKFTAETVGQAGDSFYDNIEQALNDGSFAAGSGNEDKLQSFDRMMTEALTNPRISVKGERIEVMNKVREAAYNARLEDYVQAATTANPTLTRPQAEAEFKAKYGDFRQLYSNDELKIPHPKAQMPTGWRRATIADTMGSHIPSGLKEGDWIQTGAGGTITRLRADEIKRAEAIEQQNIQADINNSLNP